LVAILALLILASAYAAQAYQHAQVTEAGTAIDRSHAAFAARLATAMAEGTPADALNVVAIAERSVYQADRGAQAVFVDRLALNSFRQRAGRIDGYRLEVAAIEAQLEVDLNHALRDALQRIHDGLDPAKAAGLDTGEYEKYLADGETDLAALRVPSAAAAMVDAAQARGDALARSTADRVAANLAAAQALADAKTAAAASLTRAQRDLAQAQGVPVLDVKAQAAAIAAIAGRLTGATTTDEFRLVAANLDNQAAALENLIYTRGATYQLLQDARGTLAAARAAKVNVDADAQGLDAAAQALDQAGTLDALVAVRNQIKALKNDLDFQTYQAQIAAAAGHLIIISLHDQHLRAVQDGVVLLETDVATGRPALPTPIGVTHVMAKYSPYLMQSPWPRGSAYWYPSTWIKYAILFRDGGYFIHDAPWRSVWGPGANATNGTHGCVNVPIGAETWLFNWAPVGATVDVVP
jgi:lipoprotein-anchoring transpeptidase ErfK/SrfK